MNLDLLAIRTPTFLSQTEFVSLSRVYHDHHREMNQTKFEHISITSQPFITRIDQNFGDIKYIDGTSPIEVGRGAYDLLVELRVTAKL